MRVILGILSYLQQFCDILYYCLRFVLNIAQRYSVATRELSGNFDQPILGPTLNRSWISQKHTEKLFTQFQKREKYGNKLLNNLLSLPNGVILLINVSCVC